MGESSRQPVPVRPVGLVRIDRIGGRVERRRQDSVPLHLADVVLVGLETRHVEPLDGIEHPPRRIDVGQDGLANRSVTASSKSFIFPSATADSRQWADVPDADAPKTRLSIQNAKKPSASRVSGTPASRGTTAGGVDCSHSHRLTRGSVSPMRQSVPHRAAGPQPSRCCELSGIMGRRGEPLTDLIPVDEALLACQDLKRGIVGSVKGKAVR